MNSETVFILPKGRWILAQFKGEFDLETKITQLGLNGPSIERRWINSAESAGMISIVVIEWPGNCFLKPQMVNNFPESRRGPAENPKFDLQPRRDNVTVLLSIRTGGQEQSGALKL
jgi:hypothetical protein